MAIQICMGGYGPPTTTHSRALKLMGERLAAQFGKDVDIKYVWNVMDFGYKAEEVLWMSERGIYCNRAAFESWPQALQAAMLQATREAVVAQRDLAVREEEVAKRAIEDAGGEVVELTPEERAAFVRAVKPLHDEARTRFGEAFSFLQS